ncbi:MAG: radical SAM family heme chaperone HemW [Leptospirales bacterium]|nr:radical SAM family heme chaperone HemW [Leptospirales bacterium]
MKSSPIIRAPHRNTDNLGVYVHFPYCIHKCSYCDFYSVGMDRAMDGGKTVTTRALADYMQALQSEFAERKKLFRQRRINTIFFGGGTASLLPAENVFRILEMLRTEFEMDSRCEITLEGNPENFSPDYIASLKQTGVNRIHVGIQSLRPAILKQLDRYYDEERYAAILETLKGSTIVNRGVDLMYGVPGQTEEDFYQDLDRLLDTGITHVSLYSLTVEHGTPYDVMVRKGVSPPPDEEMQEQIFSFLPQRMRDRGFVHYEVSNYGKPGQLSRHNLRYWLYEPTLALGPGAHGFTGTSRYANVRNTPGWQSAPLAAALESHEPALELPLCFLRILLPLEREELQRIVETEVPGKWDAVSRTLESWAMRGLARFDSVFEWKLEGLMRLNDRVVELQEVLVSK